MYLWHVVFIQLKEVVGLFIVPPENLKGLMEHGHLANTDRLEIHNYIKQRADYSIHGLRAPYVRALFEDASEYEDEDVPITRQASVQKPSTSSTSSGGGGGRSPAPK